MTLDELEDSKTVTGARQVSKAVKRGDAECVFIAQDADQYVTGPLADLCSEYGVPVENVPDMVELGKRCGIQVGAAAAAAVRDK